MRRGCLRSGGRWYLPWDTVHGRKDLGGISCTLWVADPDSHGLRSSHRRRHCSLDAVFPSHEAQVRLRGVRQLILSLELARI